MARRIDYIDSDILIDQSLSDESIFYKTDEGKILIDGEILKGKAANLAIKSTAVAKNVHSATLSGIKNVSQIIVEKFDKKIQDEVDNVTLRNKRGQQILYNISTLFSKLNLIFGPIVFIYILLPLLS